MTNTRQDSVISSSTAATAGIDFAPPPSLARELEANSRSGGRLPSHIPALDGIRGIAVLLVLFCHATGRPFGDPEAINAAFTGPIDRGLLTLARLSWTGVDLFFVLSGFLITGILFDAKGKDHFFRNFYARRTVRIFPLYYASLILFLVIWPMLPAWMSRGFGELPGATWPYWLYVSNFSQSLIEQGGSRVEHPVHVSWSLSIEEQFYLCWPLIVFLSSRKTLLGLCGLMYFGSMIFRTGMWYTGHDALAMGFTFGRLDALAVGAAIALFARGATGIRPLVKPAFVLLPLAAFSIMALVAIMYKLGFRQGIGQSPGYIIGGTALFAIMYGSMLVIAITAAERSWLQWFFSHALFRTFGKYSYAVYLFHLPIMILIAEHWFRPSSLPKAGPTMLPGLLTFYAVTWTASLLVAIVSWHVLEKHFLKLKDYFPMEKKASTATGWQGKDAAKADPA